MVNSISSSRSGSSIFPQYGTGEMKRPCLKGEEGNSLSKSLKSGSLKKTKFSQDTIQRTGGKLFKANPDSLNNHSDKEVIPSINLDDFLSAPKASIQELLDKNTLTGRIKCAFKEGSEKSCDVITFLAGNALDVFAYTGIANLALSYFARDGYESGDYVQDAVVLTAAVAFIKISEKFGGFNGVINGVFRGKDDFSSEESYKSQITNLQSMLQDRDAKIAKNEEYLKSYARELADSGETLAEAQNKLKENHKRELKFYQMNASGDLRAKDEEINRLKNEVNNMRYSFNAERLNLEERYEKRLKASSKLESEFSKRATEVGDLHRLLKQKEGVASKSSSWWPSIPSAGWLFGSVGGIFDPRKTTASSAAEESSVFEADKIVEKT